MIISEIDLERKSAPPLHPPPGIPPVKCHPGAPELNKFFTTEHPNNLPDLEVLNEIFENCADYTRCPKCLCFGVLARKGPTTIACTTTDCRKTLPRELLPSAYLLGLSKHGERRSRSPRSTSRGFEVASTMLRSDSCPVAYQYQQRDRIATALIVYGYRFAYSTVELLPRLIYLLEHTKIVIQRGYIKQLIDFFASHNQLCRRND